MTRMHADELELDEALVRRLLAEQFPEWAELPLQRIEPSGTVNAIFRLGDGLSVRLPRKEGPTEPGGVELEWLPKLASRLPSWPCSEWIRPARRRGAASRSRCATSRCSTGGRDSTATRERGKPGNGRLGRHRGTARRSG